MREKLGGVVFVVQPQKDGFVRIDSAIEGRHCSGIHLETDFSDVVGCSQELESRRVEHAVTIAHVPLLRDTVTRDTMSYCHWYSHLRLLEHPKHLNGTPGSMC